MLALFPFWTLSTILYSNTTQNFGDWICFCSRVERSLPLLVTVSLTGSKSLCGPYNGNIYFIIFFCYNRREKKSSEQRIQTLPNLSNFTLRDFRFTQFKNNKNVKRHFVHVHQIFLCRKERVDAGRWTEIYCWAKSQSRCRRSDCIVLDFALQLDFLVYTYLNTNIHTYIRTYVNTYIHTYIHTHIHNYIHTYIYTYIHT